MVLESIMVCVDNSDYMRNGDFLPTRLNAQQDAVNLICHSKTRANPENNVGLLSTANTTEVLVTLTTDVGKILSKLHQMQPKGNISFVSAIRVAHLVLKHRQGKNHRMRIIVFVGSPICEDDRELTKLAKRLRKEKVNVDVVNFGEEASNTDKLTVFINTLNGTDGTSSHLVTVPSGVPGPLLSEALVSSPILLGEDGVATVSTGFEFGIDPNEDPELALALRVSLEEQRARQEEESRKVTAASIDTAGGKAMEETVDEHMLKQALELSQTEMSGAGSTTSTFPRDISALSEEEQMAYALQISMAHEPMEAEEGASGKNEEQLDAADTDISDVITNVEFLTSILSELPGVNPEDVAIQEAMKQITKPPTAADDKAKKDEKKKDGGKKEDKK